MTGTENTRETAGSPEEIVLRYEALPEARVARYVHPDPLPGGRAKMCRPHNNRWLYFAYAALLLLFAASVCLRVTTAERGRAHGASETTIARYPGSGVRLRISAAHGEPLTTRQIYERVSPCTVTISASFSDGTDSVGSGVILSEDGYLLTNAHVIQGAEKASVALNDGSLSHDAKLVGLDEANDLAVLKIDAVGLSAAELGDSDALTVGDSVYAIGTPLGVELRGTLTDGIVSAVQRDMPMADTVLPMIQTNVALNHGSSGGALVNIYGQVVGITTMKLGSKDDVSLEGLGFAIPANRAARVVDRLTARGLTL